MANGALAKIGEPPISSLLDKKRAAARHCLRFFAETRDALLRDRNWEFARNSCAPAALPARPNPKWSFRYVMPADCVNVIQVGPFDDPWESPSSGDDVTVAIFCDTNATAPTIWYTRRVVNPAQWNPLFRELFKTALAAAVNPIIGRDKSLTQGLVQMAAAGKDDAAKRDAQGRVGQQISRTTSWVKSRWGYLDWPT